MILTMNFTWTDEPTTVGLKIFVHQSFIEHKNHEHKHP